ncbi:hypothetical protein EXIGLDRAFT_357908 [Exidia glandulosa HHB12029]|uniref:Uncharacterized protein n=1 Tax=Exidia glandulosa HHB12029 TaxID=1314781 RepID=A0A165LB36_EXIGL|nr:hypothetical protein EXIGLDRAFT_357908 [Exidia glandulosa HHB12029]
MCSLLASFHAHHLCTHPFRFARRLLALNCLVGRSALSVCDGSAANAFLHALSKRAGASFATSGPRFFRWRIERRLKSWCARCAPRTATLSWRIRVVAHLSSRAALRTSEHGPLVLVPAPFARRLRYYRHLPLCHRRTRHRLLLMMPRPPFLALSQYRPRRR